MTERVKSKQLKEKDNSATGNGLRPGHKRSIGNRGPQMRMLGRYITAVLNDELQQIDPQHKLPNVRLGIKKLVEQFAKGDLDAIQMCWDRAEGRPTQAVEVSGPDQSAIETITVTMSAEEAMQRYADTLNGEAVDQAPATNGHDSE